MAHIAGASVQSRIGIGEREGLRVRRVGGSHSIGEAYSVSTRCALPDGFSLHANVQIKGGDRNRLEKLCRYTARPPIALERLSETAEGKILYQLKTRYSDGTTHILFDPMELVEKVVALIPPPRANLLRYHGLLAPNSKMRAKIIPERKEENEKEGKAKYPEQARWAELLKRSFAIEILKCSQCSGKMKVISTIQDLSVARRILDSMGLPSEIPKRSPARAPPQQEFFVNQPDDPSQLSLDSDSFD